MPQRREQLPALSYKNELGAAPSLFMKIGIDLSVVNINQAGTAIYAHNLVEALKSLSDKDEYRIFAVNQQYDMAQRKTARSRLDTIYRDLVWMHGILPWQAWRAQVNVLHVPMGVMPLFVPCPTIVSILDTTILQMPQNFTVWHRNYSRLLIPLAARRASKILTISEHSKRDIVRQFKVPTEKVVVTYLAASAQFRPLSEAKVLEVKRRYNLDTFILTVGTLEPRKNISRLLQAFALLRRRGLACQLVHVGPKGWLYDSVLADVERLGLEGSVRFWGRVPLDDLVGLYNAAKVFVYPSLYEGFGLPVLEAMACGCPVVASNKSSIPEVVGEAGVTIDPLNVEALAGAINRVLADTTLAQSLHQRGLERASRFSWQRCAQETAAVYHQALGQ